MDGFRYAQFCPLARAAEILGHRWVLPILRELFLGPWRFVDLRRRLPGLSSSVLADRLAALEAVGVVARRELPPPAAATVYELTGRGRALAPALVELTRWGTRFLELPRPGDHVEPDWLRMAVVAFARSGPTPPRRFELRVVGPRGEATVRVGGGPGGTHLLEDEGPADVRLRAPVLVVMGLMSGLLPAAGALARADVSVEGDAEALADLPTLFAMDLESGSEVVPDAFPRKELP